MLGIMDPKDTASPVATNAFKKNNWLGLLVTCSIAVLIAIPVGLIGYQSGFTQGKKVAPSPTSKVKPITKKIVAKITNNDAVDDGGSSTENAPGQENSYNVFYTPPVGWRAMVWHPDPDSVGTALFSPDYTSIDDPSPQAGFSILIYQFPGKFDSLEQLRPEVEQTEEGMVSLTTTTIAGYPTYHAIFNDSDSGRYLEDYDILKTHDRWLIRIDYPGPSYAAMQEEEQKYSIQINQFLQSIQFKAIQNQ